MAIQGIPSAGLHGISGAGAPKGPGFAQALKQAGAGKSNPASAAAKPKSAHLAMAQQVSQVDGKSAVKTVNATQPGKVIGLQQVQAKAASQMLERINTAQQQMDQVLKLAQSGKSFTPAELLSLQAQVYSASQELDLAGKVVEKATGGVKQVLQTQV